MLKKNYNYYAKFVRFPQNKYTGFSVGIKDNDNGGYKNYSIFCFEKHDIKDGDKIKFKEFISIDQQTYNGKTKISVAAEIEVVKEEVASDVIGSGGDSAIIQEDRPIAQTDTPIAQVDAPIGTVDDTPIEDDKVISIDSDELPF